LSHNPDSASAPARLTRVVVSGADASGARYETDGGCWHL